MFSNTLGWQWYINREDDIFVTVTDESGCPIDHFRLKSGHPAFKWTDEHLKEYLTLKILEN